MANAEGNIWDWFYNTGRSIMDGTYNALESIVDPIWNGITSVGNGIGGAFQDIGSGFENLVTGNRDFTRQKELANMQNEFNALEAQKARNHATAERIGAQLYNTAEAQKNRDWQTQLSNTAFQRQVRDIKNAGYNPLGLIGGSGATVGSSGIAQSHSGSSASASATGVPTLHSASALGQTVSSLTGSAVNLARLATVDKYLSKHATNASAKALQVISRMLKP